MADLLPRGRLSYETYTQTPSDGRRYEFLVGEVYVTPAPSPAHQHASKRLLIRLVEYFEAPKGAIVFDAPIDVILSDDEIVQPDLIVVQDISTISNRGIEGPPFVIVEIISPSRLQLDRIIKLRQYAAHGVPHYWLVDPSAQRMECLLLSNGRYAIDALGERADTLKIPAFPGLTVDMGSLRLQLPLA